MNSDNDHLINLTCYLNYLQILFQCKFIKLIKADATKFWPSYTYGALIFLCTILEILNCCGSKPGVTLHKLGSITHADWNHSVYWGITHPSKTPPPLFCQAPPLPPPKNLQTVQAPFLGNSFLYIGFLGTPPNLKNGVFQWTPIILKFFIFNPISSFKSNRILS